MNRDLILFVILVPVFLVVSFYISFKVNNKLPDYSVMNKSNQGFSIFYETLEKLNYHVGRTFNSVESINTHDIQIVSDSGNFNINSSNVKNWVKRGGTLVYLSSEDGEIHIYKYGRGNVIIYDKSNITNKTLTVDTHKAYELLREMDRYSYRKIYFNEKYLFSADDKTSLWDYIPLSFKYLLYQGVIVLAAFFYYRGKRFGKPVPLYEEVERGENEYLYSAASLYREAKCWDLMIGNYYKDFLNQINCYDENWLQYWKDNQLGLFNQAKRVYEFIHRESGGFKAKECMAIISAIEKLKDIERQRRDSYWKIMKKSQ